MTIFDFFDYDVFDEEEYSFISLQRFAGSRKEAISLTGDDLYYEGDDEDEDDYDW